MATLAEMLRQTGYAKDGQLEAPAPTQPNLSTMAGDYIRQLPAKTAQNAIDMNYMVQNAMPYNPQTGKFETGPTFSEFANYVPNMMGSTNAVAPRKEVIGGIFDKVMGVFGNNQKIPQLPEGVLFEKLHPNVQSKVREGKIIPEDAQWMSDYANTAGNSLVETGTGATKDLSEKMQNYMQKIKNKEVFNPWPDQQ